MKRVEWQWLWVLVGILYLAFIALFAHSTWPTRDQVMSDWANALNQQFEVRFGSSSLRLKPYGGLSDEQVLVEVHSDYAPHLTYIPANILDPFARRHGYSNFAAMADAKAQSRTPAARSRIEATLLQRGERVALSLAKIDVEHERALLLLRKEQVKFLSGAALAWVLPMAVLYGIGASKERWLPLLPRVYGLGLVIAGLLVLRAFDLDKTADFLGALIIGGPLLVIGTNFLVHGRYTLPWPK
ncbi:MAG: hypothetical protein ACRD1S_11125 [Vicinamibacterales bacterium]